MHLAVSLQEKFPDELECVSKAFAKFPQGICSSTDINQHLSIDSDGFTSLCAPQESSQRHALPFATLLDMQGGRFAWSGTLKFHPLVPVTK